MPPSPRRLRVKGNMQAYREACIVFYIAHCNTIPASLCASKHITALAGWSRIRVLFNAFALCCSVLGPNFSVGSDIGSSSHGSRSGSRDHLQWSRLNNRDPWLVAAAAKLSLPLLTERPAPCETQGWDARTAFILDCQRAYLIHACLRYVCFCKRDADVECKEMDFTKCDIYNFGDVKSLEVLQPDKWAKSK